MKKFLLSTFVLGVFSVYSIHLKFGDHETPIVAIRTSSPSFSPQVTGEPPVAALGPVPVSTPVPSKPPQGKYKDGTYTGNVADAFYGNIQVQAVISGGKITDVIFLQYPNDRSTSIYINTQAMPLLKEEAISVQSAQVDGVSGATASSQAFVESLGSALNKAI